MRSRKQLDYRSELLSRHGMGRQMAVHVGRWDVEVQVGRDEFQVPGGVAVSQLRFPSSPAAINDIADRASY